MSGGEATARGRSRRTRGWLSGALLVTLLGLASCSAASAGTPDPAAPAGAVAPGAVRPISVVASTDVWGEIAEQIGGRYVRVRSLISDMHRDAHSFQPSGRDALAVSRAAVVIENGGGYDDFMTRLRHGVSFDGAVIDAFALAEHHGQALGDNEHVWYSPTIVTTVATSIAATLSHLAPAHAADFDRRLATFDRGMDRVAHDLAALRDTSGGTPVLATESVAGYLIAGAGLRDRTPPALAEAVEEDTDIRPTQLADVLAAVSHHEVAAVLYNEQEPTAQGERIVAAADTAGVPVVALTELLPHGNTYQQWMTTTIAQLRAALEQGHPR